MFPGCTVAPLGGMGDMPVKGKPGRTREHDCDADRKRASRDQFKSELRMALDLVAGGDRAARHCSPAIAELRQQMSEFGHGKDTALSTMGRADLDAIGGTVFASIFHANRWTSFHATTSRHSSTACATSISSRMRAKEMNGLISPSIFDPSLSDDTSRGLANIRAIWGIWLDNDGGDLRTKSSLGCSHGSAW